MAVQQIGLQLALQILLAADDVFLTAFLLEPLLDLVACLRCLDHLEPVALRTVGLLGGDDFDNIAVLQIVVDRCNSAIDLTSGHAVADSGMNAVGKVNRRRTGRQVDDIALRGKYEYLVRKQVDLDRFDEVLCFGVLLSLQQLTNPGIGVLVAFVCDTLFVFPMRCNAVFRHLMHLFRADLHFKRDSCAADDRRVQGAVTVRLRRRDIVLESSRNRLVQIVYIAQYVVAVGYRFYNDAHRADVIDLTHVLVL